MPLHGSISGPSQARRAGRQMARPREEDFDFVAGLPEVSSPGGGRGFGGVQFGNAAQTPEMRRPNRPLARAAFWNHRARIQQGRPKAMCSSARCAGYFGLNLPSASARPRPVSSTRAPSSARRSTKPALTASAIACSSCCPAMPADRPTASARRQARGLCRLKSKSAATSAAAVASRSSSRGTRSFYRPVSDLGSVRNAAVATCVQFRAPNH